MYRQATCGLLVVLFSAEASAGNYGDIERRLAGLTAVIELRNPSDGESLDGARAHATQALDHVVPRLEQALRHYRTGQHRYRARRASLLPTAPMEHQGVRVHFRVAEEEPGAGFGLEPWVYLNVDGKLAAEARQKLGDDFILAQLQPGGVLAGVKPVAKGSLEEALRYMDAMLAAPELAVWLEVARRYEPWVRELAARAEPPPPLPGYTEPTAWLVAMIVVTVFDGTPWPERLWPAWRGLSDRSAFAVGTLMLRLLDDKQLAAGRKRLEAEAAKRPVVAAQLKPWFAVR